MLLNGNGHFAVHEADGRIISIEIFSGLFSPDSEIKSVELYVVPRTAWYGVGEDDNEVIDFTLHLDKKNSGICCKVYLQKDKSEVLRKFLDYIDENKHQILQCDYEHGCSLFVTDVDFE